MCKYCELDSDGDFETWADDEGTRAYLNQYGHYEWSMTSVYDSSNGYNLVEVPINNCPWCGRELY